MNPLIKNPDLMDKLHKQYSANGGIQGQFDVNSNTVLPAQQTSVDQSVNQAPIDWNQANDNTVPDSQPKVRSASNVPGPGPLPDPTEPVPVEDKPGQQEAPTPAPTPTPAPQRSIQDQIQEVESKLGEAPQNIADVTARAKAFLDEYNDETFYVENQSNGHIVISDMDITIKRAKCEDLLKFATLEDLKKSRDLRAMLASAGLRPMLKRLTQEEYLVKKKREYDNKRVVEQMKTQHAQTAQQNPQQPQAQPQQPQQVTPRINPTILSKLEKLRLSTVPESAHLGLTPPEFIEWVLTESLSSEELDFVASHPNVVHNNEIRTAVYQRKSEIE